MSLFFTLSFLFFPSWRAERTLLPDGSDISQLSKTCPEVISPGKDAISIPVSPIQVVSDGNSSSLAEFLYSDGESERRFTISRDRIIAFVGTSSVGEKLSRGAYLINSKTEVYPRKMFLVESLVALNYFVFIIIPASSLYNRMQLPSRLFFSSLLLFLYPLFSILLQGSMFDYHSTS